MLVFGDSFDVRLSELVLLQLASEQLGTVFVRLERACALLDIVEVIFDLLSKLFRPRSIPTNLFFYPREELFEALLSLLFYFETLSRARLLQSSLEL